MSKTAQLLALADAAIDEYNKDDGTWYTTCSLSFLSHRFIDGADGKFIAAANPETIKQMCLREQELEKLVQLHAGLVKRYRKETPLGCQPYMIAEKADEALEAFNKWEGK